MMDLRLTDNLDRKRLGSARERKLAVIRVHKNDNGPDFRSLETLRGGHDRYMAAPSPNVILRDCDVR